MKQKGSMTVFFCLITVLISALIGTCIESARTAGLRFMAQTAAGSAMQSVFADYHEELWERYRVFFHHDTDGLQNDVEEYLSYYEEPEKGVFGLPENTDLWGLSVDEVELSECKTILYEGGRLFLEQAVEYEKYRVAANVLEMFFEQAGILDEIGKVRSFIKRISGCMEVIRQINTMYQDVRDVVVDVQAGIKIIKDILDSRELSLKELQEKIGQIGELFSHLSQSVVNYLETAENIYALVQELKQEYGDEEGTIYGEQIGQMEMFTSVGKIGKAVLKLKDRLEMVGEELAALESEVSEWFDAKTPVISEREKAEDIRLRLEKIVEGCLSIMKDTESIFAENEAGDKFDQSDLEDEELADEGKGLLARVRDWKNMAVLTLVLGGDAEKVKKSRISVPEMLPSNQMSERLSEVTVVEKALFAFYIGDVFTSWMSEEQGEFAYQQEYILFEKEDSHGNLVAMAETLLAVREALNLAYLLANEEMRMLTESVALSLVGATGLYPVVLIVQFILMAAWAFAESVWDVKSLFRGEEIPIWKTEGSWKTSLAGLISVPEAQSSPERTSEKGISLSYNDYLRIFLFLNRTEKLCVASLDMIQEEMGRVDAGFLLSDCYGSAECRVEFSSENRLITMPLIGVLPEGRHRVTVETGYQY